MEVMFIFKNANGKYYSQRGSKGINNKKQAEFFYLGRNNSKFEYMREQDDSFWVDDINEAKLFGTVQAIRSHNCYSWGGTPVEVKVHIEAVA